MNFSQRPGPGSTHPVFLFNVFKLLYTMAANLRKQQRDQLIYSDYASLWGEGKREEVIWPVLEEKYHMAPTTIYRIVLKMSKQVTTPKTHQPNEKEH